jgi:recombination protein RecT
MNMDHQLQTNKPKFSVAIQSDTYKNLINNTLGDKEVARQFVADISSVVSNNYNLANCDAATILSAGLTACSLKLPLSPTLGFCYVVPYKDKAQFQIGYKGLIQLAERTGQYLTIGVRPVHKGEYSGQDEFGEDKFKFSHDFDMNDTVGYFAYFKLINGFTKTLYMTTEQCQEHGKRYSRSFSSDKGTNLWRDSFDMMAEKTVLKLLINRYGIMSVEMQKAIKYDQAVIDEKGNAEYVDNDESLSPSGERVGATKSDDSETQSSNKEDSNIKDSPENTSSEPVEAQKEPEWVNARPEVKFEPKDPKEVKPEDFLGKQVK